MRPTPTILLLTLSALCTCARAADGPTSTPFDRSKHPWARFGEGTWVTGKLTSTIGDQVTSLYRTVKVTKVTEKTCTICIYEGPSADGDKLNEVTFALVKPEALLVPMPDDGEPTVPKAVGTETIKVGSMKHECTLWELPAGREWYVTQYAVDAKGQIVRKASGVKKNGKLLQPKVDQLTATDEQVEWSGKVYSCRVMECIKDEEGEKRKVFECSDVPGGILKNEETTVNGEEVNQIEERSISWQIVEPKKE
ncbi:MAG: hypothetical protein L6R28_16510 [Planctomycetes bacterium]|nr:hypothetical protein [Planctomycetota bacterium]